MKCRICSHPEQELVVDLGKQPWGNNFLKPEQVGKEAFYPLHVVMCKKCSCVQLDYTVPKETMFVQHTYLSGMTKTLDTHFLNVAWKIRSVFGLDTPLIGNLNGLRVLDIGSNDGTQLKHYQRLGASVMGVESAVHAARIANRYGIPTLNRFYDKDEAVALGEGYADIINASGVFFHLEDLHSVTDGIKYNLNHNGVFVIQFIPTRKILENFQFDYIYHEHLLYYSLKTLEQLLAMHGLELFDVYQTDVLGGWMVAYAGHPGQHKKTDALAGHLKCEEEIGINTPKVWKEFASKLEALRQKERKYLADARAAGKVVYGMGAPVRGNTLLNYIGATKEDIHCLVEKNPYRNGLYAPGSHIPVLYESNIGKQPDIYYVLAWIFEKEIRERYKDLIDGGVEFHFPGSA